MRFVSLKKKCFSMIDTSFRQRLELRDRTLYVGLKFLGQATTNPSSLPSRLSSKKVFFCLRLLPTGGLAQHWICLKRTKDGVHSIKSFMLKKRRELLSLERKELFPAFFPFYWFLKAINLLFPHIFYPSRIGSASDDEPMRKLSLFFSLDRQAIRLSRKPTKA